MIEPRLDDGGVLRQPDLHDGHLLGVVVSPERTATLTFRDLSGRSYEMTLHEVDLLRAQGFAEGNIVLEVAMFPATRCPREVLDDLYDHDPAFDAAAYIAREKADRHVLTITPSYGCSLVALFARWTLRGL